MSRPALDVCPACSHPTQVQNEAGHVKWRAHRDCLNSGRWLCYAPARVIPGIEPTVCPHDDRS